MSGEVSGEEHNERTERTEERALQAAIMTEFGTLDDVVVNRNNVGTANYGTAKVAYGLGGKGAPDLMIEVRITTNTFTSTWAVLWVEVKTPNGRIDKHQREWHAAARRRGRPCVVARSVGDVRVAIGDVRRGAVTIYDRSKGKAVCDGE